MVSWASSGLDFSRLCLRIEEIRIHDTTFTEFRFTWREKRQDTVPEPFVQEEHLDTCWAIALFRGQSALVRIKGSDRALLTLEMLLAGPVVVAFDVFPSYEDKFVPALGQGIFTPTDVECEMRLYQRFTRHCVVLYGKGVEMKGQRIKEFWEALESRGDKFGDTGFVLLARGKCLIREVVELKEESLASFSIQRLII
ncbi:hypothetical protein YC2023_049025 [Brassica napus]